MSEDVAVLEHGLGLFERREHAETESLAIAQFCLLFHL